MASTTAVLQFKPSWGAVTSGSRSTTASMVIPFRVVSGQYSTNLQNSTTKKPKNWKPSALHPVTDKNGLIDPAWNRFFSYLSNSKLGGPNYPTLPDVTQYLTKSQVDSIVNSAISQALEQQVQANAQTLAAVVQKLPDQTQIPPVVLVKQDTTPPPAPVLPNFGETGGGDGGGGSE